MVRKRVIVRGLVQGVGFRYTARTEARRLGVAGYVRNRPDGAVESEIEGDEERVAAMVDWLETGPPGAIVEAVSVTETEPADETGFRIEV